MATTEQSLKSARGLLQDYCDLIMKLEAVDPQEARTRAWQLDTDIANMTGDYDELEERIEKATLSK